MKSPTQRTDDTERWLSETIEAARRRIGDEVARRRVWARVEGLPAGQDRPLRRARALALPALTGALVAIGVVAILRMVPATRPTHAPVVSKRAPSATACA